MLEPPPQLADEANRVRATTTRANALVHLGRIDEAHATLDRDLPPTITFCPAQAEAEMSRGMIAHSRGHYDTARETFERAYHLASSCGHHRIGFASARMVLALVSEVPLDVELGEPWYRHAHNSLGRIEPPEGAKASLWLLRSPVLVRLGRTDEALAAAERAVAWLEEHLPTRHAFIGDAYSALSFVHDALGDASEERAATQGALRHHELAFGPVHPQVGIDLFNLAGVDLALGRLDDAVEPLHRSLGILRETLGPDHHFTLGAAARLGRLHHDRGDLEAGMTTMRETIAAIETSRGPSDEKLAPALRMLAGMTADAGDLPEALAFARRSITIDRDRGSKVELARSLRQGATLSLRADRIDEARRRVDEARELLEPLLPAQRVDIGRVYRALGTIQHAQGDTIAADASLRQALAHLSEVDAPQHEARTHADLAEVLVATGRADDARRHLDTALVLYESAGDTRRAAEIRERLDDPP